MTKNFIEESVTIKGEAQLKGTMAIPTGEQEKFPAILLINGSGAADRDGNMKKPKLEANIYKDLAHFISELGFITLRYDKRGVGESEGDALTTGMMDLVKDINCNVEFLRQHPKVDEDKIILLGHSEGCILSTMANTMSPVSGLILLGGAGVNLKDPLIYQNELILEEIKRLKGFKGFLLRTLLTEEKIKKQQQGMFKTLMESTGDTVRYKLKKMPAKWFREHFSYTTEDVLKDLETANCPILAITGEKDAQANPVSLKSIDELGKENIKCNVIKNMDHMMKEYAGEITILEIIKQYKKEVSQPTHPELLKQLELWLKETYPVLT